MKHAIVAVLVLAGSARAATITIAVTNVRDARGHVLVAICPEAQFLRPHCLYQGRAPSNPGTTLVTIGGVPPGRYAAEAYQDSDDNNRLDRTLLGLPAEGMGFSNDARMIFGPPSFAAAAFTISHTDLTITLRLKYY